MKAILFCYSGFFCLHPQTSHVSKVCINTSISPCKTNKGSNNISTSPFNTTKGSINPSTPPFYPPTLQKDLSTPQHHPATPQKDPSTPTFYIFKSPFNTTKGSIKFYPSTLQAEGSIKTSTSPFNSRIHQYVNITL